MDDLVHGVTHWILNLPDEVFGLHDQIVCRQLPSFRILDSCCILCGELHLLRQCEHLLGRSVHGVVELTPEYNSTVLLIWYTFSKLVTHTFI
jgi:hypothetical protein